MLNYLTHPLQVLGGGIVFLLYIFRKLKLSASHLKQNHRTDGSPANSDQGHLTAMTTPPPSLYLSEAQFSHTRELSPNNSSSMA